MGGTELYFVLTLMIPLLGAMIAHFLKPKFASTISVISIGIGFIFSLFLIVSTDTWMSIFAWMPSFELRWRLDRVSMLLISLVLFISLLVHVFSLKYMKEESHPRYFAKLGFFTFSMLGLLSSDHLILLFIFWELVGISSYLLIGFWHKKDEAATSAKWAFMTNRAADVALFSAIIGLGISDTFFMSQLSGSTSIWIGCGLLIGAMGKSGQFPFMAWLPRAMTGPTPVSALIHAATMVAAGVYLLIRVAPILPELILNATVIIGVVTATIGAFSALTQHDIKKVLAYSTVSQLGFMFLGIGVGSVGSAFFHLWTHAFFKAGLFLTVGAIIHHLNTQDMRKMGGLGPKMPLVFGGFLICGLALSGIPLFSGYMSKEGILQAVWQWSLAKSLTGYSEAHLVSIFAFFSVFMTAWYFGRQVWLIFMGEERTVSIAKRKKIEYSMIIPFILLGIGSFWITQNWNPLSSTGFAMEYASFSRLPSSGTIAFWSISLAIIGLVLSYFFYRSRTKYTSRYAEKSAPGTIIGRLSYFGFYLDSIYVNIISPTYLLLSRIAEWIDRKIFDKIVDGLGVSVVVLAKFVGLVDRLFVDGFVKLIGGLAMVFGDTSRRMQSKFVQTQLIWLLLGIIFILIYILFF